MAATQADSAFSASDDPISALDTTSPKEKPNSAERHKAPTTKDVEANRWVFGQELPDPVAGGAVKPRNTNADVDRNAIDTETTDPVTGDGDGTAAVETEDGEGGDLDGEGKKKRNPLRKVVDAVKNI